MPPKPEADTKTEKTTEKKRGAAFCGVTSPGPRYKLKAVVGYNDHCVSKLRNPAYTFGRRQFGAQTCEGPGPKYAVVLPRHDGFTIGYAAKSFDTSCGPGPKYLIQDPPKSPMFSIRWRTKHRKGCDTPGPYYIKSTIPGPAFSIGLRAGGARCDGGPGPLSPYSLDTVKPRSPMFSIGFRQTGSITCDSPGPKYKPEISRSSPKFSFGVKHSECAPPYIVECDD